MDRGTVRKLQEERALAANNLRKLKVEIAERGGNVTTADADRHAELERNVARLDGQIELIEQSLADAAASTFREASAPAYEAELRYGQPMSPAQVRQLTTHGRAYGDEEAVEALGWYVRAASVGDWSIIPDKFKPQTRALSVGVGSGGGYTVPEALSGAIIDLAVANSVALKAGISVVPMNNGSVTVPKHAGTVTGQWVDEGETITAEDLTFGAVTLTAKRLSTIVKASIEVVQDSILDLGSFVAGEVAKAFAREIDKGVLAGSGASGSLLGIRNWSGVPATGSIGSADYDDLIDGVSAVRIANRNPGAQVLFERTATALAKLKVNSEANHYVTPPAYLDGIKRLSTTNLSYENSTEAYIITGEFKYSYLGVRLDTMSLYLDQKYAETGQVGWVFHWRGDHVVGDTAAFDLRTGVSN